MAGERIFMRTDLDTDFRVQHMVERLALADGRRGAWCTR